MDNNGTLIGILYLDVFQRQDPNERKYDSPAHFTIRCSRRIDLDEPSTLLLQNPDTFQKRDQGVYQLPVVVLVAGFPRPTKTKPCLLDQHNIETLFHETGHAIHSMLAQTDFQHIAGTRYSTTHF